MPVETAAGTGDSRSGVQHDRKQPSGFESDGCTGVMSRDIGNTLNPYLGPGRGFGPGGRPRGW